MFKCVSNVTILSLLCSWHRHVVVSDTWFSSAHHTVIHIYFQFTISHWLLSLRSVLSGCHSNRYFLMKTSYLLPRAKLLWVTFFMKWSYLLPRENFKLPYLPNQTDKDPGICTQQRYSHIHTIHRKSPDFIHRNFAYLVLICAVWSCRGHAGKKVTAVTFFRCPTVSEGFPSQGANDAEFDVYYAVYLAKK